MDNHNKTVAALAAQVKVSANAHIPFRIYHGSTMSTRLSPRRSDQILDISSLSNILHIDSITHSATVEPNVPFDKLVTETLKHGLVPRIVPSFPGITLGGAFQGTAAQSSSSKAGWFEDSVTRAEVILGSGQIVHAHKSGRNEDLLRDIAGSCGTIGVVTLLDIKLIKARKYVELHYIPVYSQAEALHLLKKHYQVLDVSFLDALLFSSSTGVVMVGRLTNTREVLRPITRLNRASDPWFFLHAHSQVPHTESCRTCPFSPRGDEDLTDRSARDLIPLEDYLFRYDRGNMWMGTYGQEPKRFGEKTRWVMDRLFRTRFMQRALHHSGRSQSFIVQDITVSHSQAKEMLDWSNKNLSIYPTWLCPILGTQKVVHRPLPEVDGDMFLNISLWGLKGTISQDAKNVLGPKAYEKFVPDNRAIERKVQAVGGSKWPYALHFKSEEEFWSDFDVTGIEKARQRWSAAVFPTVWDKVRGGQDGYVDKGGPGSAFVKALLGKDYLLDQF